MNPSYLLVVVMGLAAIIVANSSTKPFTNPEQTLNTAPEQTLNTAVDGADIASYIIGIL